MNKKNQEESLISVVREIIANELYVEKEEVVPEAHFVDDLEVDSLDFNSVLMAIEEKTGINIPEDEAMSFSTVEDLENLLRRCLECQISPQSV